MWFRLTAAGCPWLGLTHQQQQLIETTLNAATTHTRETDQAGLWASVLECFAGQDICSNSRSATCCLLVLWRQAALYFRVWPGHTGGGWGPPTLDTRYLRTLRSLQLHRQQRCRHADVSATTSEATTCCCTCTPALCCCASCLLLARGTPRQTAKHCRMTPHVMARLYHTLQDQTHHAHHIPMMYRARKVCGLIACGACVHCYLCHCCCTQRRVWICMCWHVSAYSMHSTPQHVHTWCVCVGVCCMALPPAAQEWPLTT